MKFVYCAHCGTKLEVTRKALPIYGAIIEIIPSHTCSDEPRELDLTPVAGTIYIDKSEKKNFLNKVTEQIPTPLMRHSEEPQDRRPPSDIRSDIVSSAPESVLEMLRKTEKST